MVTAHVTSEEQKSFSVRAVTLENSYVLPRIYRIILLEGNMMIPATWSRAGENYWGWLPQLGTTCHGNSLQTGGIKAGMSPEAKIKPEM